MTGVALWSGRDEAWKVGLGWCERWGAMGALGEGRCVRAVVDEMHHARPESGQCGLGLTEAVDQSEKNLVSSTTHPLRPYGTDERLARFIYDASSALNGSASRSPWLVR
jgi:hypothetical protein